MNKNINDEDLLSQIDLVLSDVPELQNATISDVPDTQKDKIDGPFIKDSAYDVKNGLNISGLSSAEISAITDETYNSTRVTTVSAINQSKQEDLDKIKEEEINQYYGEENTLSSISSALDGLINRIDTGLSVVNDVKNTLANQLNYLTTTASAGSSFTQAIKSIFRVMADGAADYKDGISETNFGYRMEESWQGSSTRSFLNYFAAQNSGTTRESRKIKFLNSTPIDPGSERQSLYGTLMLGAPFLFNEYSDPRNRTLINTFIKDGKFLSLTPGMPKYNGTTYTSKDVDNQLMQTSTPESMLNYLLRNGLDAEFTNKDKRYYTFKTSYDEYFSYLETMLNVIWVKLGLASNGDSFNLFTFFNIDNSGEGDISPSGYKSLKSQYNSSIGFFTNPAGTITESVDSQQTGFGAELADKANSQSSTFQRINYLTGMGTGGAFKNASRSLGILSNSADMLGQDLGNALSRTRQAFNDKPTGGLLKTVAWAAKVAANAVIDIARFPSENDLGAMIQSYATANGMKVVYPDLWQDSSYTKSASFNFTFTSPYGDPLSIFKYVFVPFCALACFALPRQAADNGYVSPFFVRADIPGVFTSDLALLSSFTWTRGGSNALFTKDGLPRSIECSIQIQDLYPYLAMTKRISFLSANPSYAVFLNSLTGMMSLNDNSEDALNSYFKELINRVNGVESKGNRLWNRFNTTKNTEVARISREARNSVSKSVNAHSIPWLHNSSI